MARVDRRERAPRLDGCGSAQPLLKGVLRTTSSPRLERSRSPTLEKDRTAMFTSLKSALIVASLSLAGTLALVGCVADATQDDDDALAGTGAEESVGTAEEAATSNNWTPITSDGLAPLACDSGNLMTNVRCTGRYCDNISTYCHTDGIGVAGANTWTSYFSDEHGENKCKADEWVTSISCTGNYCDNVALQCTKLQSPYVVHNSCMWTGWVSEEYGGQLNFPPGYYMAGAQCSGSFCDNMRFWVCSKLW